ncbi:MAG: DUF4010 domain-containing protein [Gammaproteobacteria bacterium]|nr:DUF4010 domain-containing protein [Gammaproteobacteria bacterium]
MGLELHPDQQIIILQLAAALAVGLLIGLERGWKERDLEEGDRVAGVRTYALIGLLGGGSAMVAVQLGAVVLGLAFVAVAGVMVAAYLADFRCNDRVGITSLVAGLLAFMLGALAGLGEVAIAGAAAVVTTLLLGFKPVLHGWVNALERQELHATLKLLLITVVLLPILPDRSYGPWNALNPYELWWLVILVATLSFVGYFAIKLAGAGRGALMLGLLGGLASSTALTMHFSRLARSDAQAAPVLAGGILLASAVMIPRMVAIVALLDPALVLPLVVPAAVMALVIVAAALVTWRRAPKTEEITAPMKNPLELKAALTFGALLAAVVFLAEALKAWFGDAGVLAMAFASGAANMDAATVYLARMGGADLAPAVAATGIIIAAAVNGLVKGGMAGAIAGRALGLRVAPALAVAGLVGLAAAWLTLWA